VTLKASYTSVLVFNCLAAQNTFCNKFKVVYMGKTTILSSTSSCSLQVQSLMLHSIAFHWRPNTA